MKLETTIVHNLDDILEETAKFATTHTVKKVIIFSKNGESALSLQKYLSQEENTTTQVIAVLFPANERTFRRDKEGAVQEFVPNPLDKATLKQLEDADIKPVFGTLPFENVIVPGASNNIYTTIKRSLSLISPGLQLAIQAALMATDQGAIDAGEDTISVVGDIAISLKATNSRLLFHPKYGLKIHQIITQIQQKNS